MTRCLRVYADTSVFGGCFDDEFSPESVAFFDEVRRRKYVLVLASTTLRELGDAPANVQKVLANLPPDSVELIPDCPEILELRDEYLRLGVVGQGSQSDAEHVAAASVAGVDMIVSWNFKHIVHYEKIKRYNGVNLAMGYGMIDIYSPREVVEP